LAGELLELMGRIAFPVRGNEQGRTFENDEARSPLCDHVNYEIWLAGVCFDLCGEDRRVRRKANVTGQKI
jgi:hypothetical protein